jgi:hypothetical protein
MYFSQKFGRDFNSTEESNYISVLEPELRGK